MKSVFSPDEFYRSIHDIDFVKYYDSGFRGIIFDIDNTLVEHGFPANEKVKDFFFKLRFIGFKTVLLSNNCEPRVKSFADSVESEYIFKANKPFKAGYYKAMSMMETDVKTTLCIGDQLFTDIWGGNLCGLHTILTEPIDPKEEMQIVLKRLFERPIIKSTKRKRGLIK